MMAVMAVEAMEAVEAVEAGGGGWEEGAWPRDVRFSHAGTHSPAGAA